MRDFARLRRRFVALSVALLLVAAAAGAFLLTPYGRSREHLQAEYRKLRVERQQKEVEGKALENIDQSLVKARQQIAAFYRERLPGGYSEISSELAKLAQQSGVKHGQVRYDVDREIPAPGVQTLHVSMSVTGDYKNLVKFINALERDRVLFEPASVELTESQQGVTLALQLNTYLREGAGGTSGANQGGTQGGMQ